MKAWKVGRVVGNTRNNDPALIEPLMKEEPGPLRLSTDAMAQLEPEDRLLNLRPEFAI